MVRCLVVNDRIPNFVVPLRETERLPSGSPLTRGFRGVQREYSLQAERYLTESVSIHCRVDVFECGRENFAQRNQQATVQQIGVGVVKGFMNSQNLIETIFESIRGHLLSGSLLLGLVRCFVSEPTHGALAGLLNSDNVTDLTTSRTPVLEVKAVTWPRCAVSR